MHCLWNYLFRFDILLSRRNWLLINEFNGNRKLLPFYAEIFYSVVLSCNTTRDIRINISASSNESDGGKRNRSWVKTVKLICIENWGLNQNCRIRLSWFNFWTFWWQTCNISSISLMYVNRPFRHYYIILQGHSLDRLPRAAGFWSFKCKHHQ